MIGCLRQRPSRPFWPFPPPPPSLPSFPPAKRVDLTDAAADLLRRLYEQHGRLVFHHPRGCSDGSGPMCYRAMDFPSGDVDVHLGDLTVDGVGEPIPAWMSASHFEYWKHTHITIDAAPGRGSGFSLEALEGARFLIRSRLLTDRELRELDGTRPIPASSGGAANHRRTAAGPAGLTSTMLEAARWPA